MKTLSISFGGLATLVGVASILFIGVSTPEPAGACSCIGPFSNLTLSEVRLVNPPDVDQAEIDELVAAEEADWPVEASFEHWGYFDGQVGDNYRTVVLEVN